MNYEFHLGDYVERVDGKIGYIVKLQDYGADWYCIKNNKIYGIITQDKINKDDYSCSYKRIGKYDFAKHEVKQIEKLNYAESYINGYQVLTGRKLIDKINELVDSVNELREKIN